MALQECTLNLDRTRRELRPHGTIEFPCAGYSSEYANRANEEIPWHYHGEIELLYISEGGMQVQIPGKTFHLKKGESLFINANILHHAVAEPYCELHSLVFSSSLIAGAGNSVFAQKYMDPLIHFPCLDGCQLCPDENWQRKIINHFIAAFEAMTTGAFGYEFPVREHLSQFCVLLYQQYGSQISRDLPEANTDGIRIRKMLDFIHDHYAENLQLSQIARSADIGERESLRCFQRAIQISPIQYLIKYRLMQGASMLSDDPGSSIAEISIRCGFDSPSNFSKMFKRFFECTPKGYRKNTFL